MSSYKKLAYGVWGVLLSLILLFTSVDFVAFNLNHYRRSFDKYGITDVTGMDKANLEHTIGDVLKYFKDARIELDTRAVIRGEEREVFGEREVLHMVDVKDLFVRGRLLRNIGSLIFVVMTLFFIKKDRDLKKSIPRALLYTGVTNIGLLLIFLLLLRTDFNKYFTYFHLIFFDNDLWLLNPDTDVLIQMVPEGFFYDTAVKILLYFVSSLVILGSAGFYLARERERG